MSARAPANERTTCLRGVYREPAHSPGRVDDDAAIMRRVGEALTERGFAVQLVAADALPETPAANVFAMCERGAVLDRLSDMEKTGAIVVNAPAAIRNTYRHRMIELFARHQVPAPKSQVVATDAKKPRPADCRLGQALRFPCDPDRRRDVCRVGDRMARGAAAASPSAAFPSSSRRSMWRAI